MNKFLVTYQTSDARYGTTNAIDGSDASEVVTATSVAAAKRAMVARQYVHAVCRASVFHGS